MTHGKLLAPILSMILALVIRPRGRPVLDKPLHRGRLYRVFATVCCVLLVINSGLIPGAALPSKGETMEPGLALAAGVTDVSLAAGWNLISLPAAPANTDPSAVLAPIAGSYDFVSTYRACDVADPTKEFDPSASSGSDLQSIDHTMGLWVHMLSAATLNVSGSQPTEVTIPLCAGWNLIGYPLPDLPVAEALVSIAGKYSRVYGYDSANITNPWVVFDPAVPSWANDLTSLQTGQGYWLLVTEATTLSLSNAVAPPTINIITPGDGAEVTAPTAIQATVVPPTGQTIVSWSLDYRRRLPNGSTGQTVTLATGGGTPPETIASFDPTRLPNGVYQIDLTATASGGGSHTARVSIVVSRDLKLGQFRATYRDLDVPVSGYQMQVLRTYDSLDKELGEFGIGWRLDLANFQVSPNRILGLGGWTRSLVPCGWFVCTAVDNTSARFVTVVYPDGRTEIFDFVPEPGNSMFNSVTAAFVARAGTGTTSRLEVEGGNPILLWGQDGNLYTGFIGAGVFDPQLFKLTTLDGQVLILSRTTGLVSMTDTNGNSIQVTPGGVIASNGASIAFTRDGLGRITQVTGPTNETMTYEYSPAGDLAATIDPNGNRLTYLYDSTHTLTSTLGLGGQPLQTLHYDTAGRLTGVTDGRGNTVQIVNDVVGRQQTFTDPLGRLTTIYTYSDQGDVVRVEELFDGKSVVSTVTYDEAGRPLLETDQLGHVWRSGYDSAGNNTEFEDPDGNVTRFAYDSMSRVTTQTAADGTVITRMSYDTRGNPIEQEKADGSVIGYGRDTAGRLTSLTDPRGHVTTFSYDSAGHLKAITNALGNVTAFNFDASGRLRSIKDAEDAETLLDYDPSGNLTGITGPTGHNRTLSYDLRGNVTTETDAFGKTKSFDYDPTGQLIRSTDRNRSVITYTYDLNGQITGKNVDSGDVTAVDYDGAGQVITVANSDIIIDYTYDEMGRLLSKTTRGTATSIQPTTTISYTYDSVGRLATMTSPAGTTSYAYDDRLRLIGVTDPSGGVYSFAYDDMSRLITLSRPNGVTDSLTYDPSGNLLSRTARLGGARLDESVYAYDALDRRQSLTNLTGMHEFTYDATDQLIGATHPSISGLSDESYGYDPAGNRISSTLSSNYVYDAGDRLLSDAQYTYQYDGEGNLTRRTETASGAVTTFDWNADHRLVAIHFPDGTTTSYKYDPLGRRIEIDDNGSITRYVYNGDNIHLEYDGANNLVASYVTGLGADDVLAMVRAGQSYYYLKDGLGSTTALVNGAGAISARYTYDSFGRQIAIGSITNPFTYAGREYDSKSGLYYNRARYYDPTTGRFLSEDPALDYNLYPYVANCPTNLVDPYGAAAMAEKSQTETEMNILYVARQKNSGRCYVGITKNLKKRFYQHQKAGKNFATKLVEAVTFRGPRSREMIRQIEGAAIHSFGAAGNKQFLNKINGMLFEGVLSTEAIMTHLYTVFSVISDICPKVVF